MMIMKVKVALVEAEVIGLVDSIKEAVMALMETVALALVEANKTKSGFLSKDQWFKKRNGVKTTTSIVMFYVTSLNLLKKLEIASSE